MKGKKILAGILAAAAAAMNLSVPIAANDDVLQIDPDFNEFQSENQPAATGGNDVTIFPQIEAEEEVQLPDLGVGVTEEPLALHFDPVMQKYLYDDGSVAEPLRSPYTDVSAAELPSSYDTRDTFSSKGISLPAIRNQYSTGTCWAHATLACVEIRGLLKGLFTNDMNVNFSEAQLGYFYGVPSTDINDRLCGDTTNLMCPDNTYSISDIYNIGGNATVASTMLSAGIGPYGESHDSSLTISGYGSFPVLDESLRYRSDYYVNECNSYADDDIDAIKSAIMEYGAVSGVYYHNDAYINNDIAYYDPNNPNETNHVISIVGWDDNYSRDNFVITPDSDGAWLVRNSWGSGFGDNGYFYMSYNEPELGGICSLDVVSSKEYSGVYAYDEISVPTWVYSSGYTIANVFTADSSDPITAAGFSTYDENTTYTIKIYTDLTSDTDPTSGTLAATSTGTIQYGGYHTVDLGTSVPVTKGTKFSVVLTTTDRALSVDTNNTAPGQSFFKKTSVFSYTWLDTYNGDFGYTCAEYDGNTHGAHYGPVNMCVRALTEGSSSDTPDTPDTPAAPTNFAAEKDHTNGWIHLSWDAVAGASSYKIYYKSPSASSLSLLKETTNNYHDVSGMPTNSEFYFYVSAIVNDAETPLSEKISVIIPSSPYDLKATSGNSSASLSWSSVSGAEKYAVYQCNSSGSAYTRLGYASSNSCRITGLTNGSTYYFMTAAVIGTVESDFSNIASVIPEETEDIAITAQPTSATVIGGTKFSFTASASSSTGISMEWQYNDGSGWQKLSCALHITASGGSMTSTATVSDSAKYKDCTFRCVATDTAGSTAITNVVSLSFYNESNVTASMVEALDSSDLTNYVNYFTTLYDDSFVLTAAQFKAIELVLAADYAE